MYHRRVGTLNAMETATTTAVTADVLVVGFGRGGKVAAHALTDAGKRVVLIEQSADMYGGTCPNVGCVPTKMLVRYSSSRRLEDDAQEFFASSVAGVRELTAAFRAGNFESLDGKDTATVIAGAARFTGPHTVAVGEGDDRITVTAPVILISTGAVPVIPPVPGLADSAHLVSSTGLIHGTSPSREPHGHRRRVPRAGIRVHLPALRLPGHRPRGRQPAAARRRQRHRRGRHGEPDRGRHPRHHRGDRHRSPR